MKKNNGLDCFKEQERGHFLVPKEAIFPYPRTGNRDFYSIENEIFIAWSFTHIHYGTKAIENNTCTHAQILTFMLHVNK